MLVDFMLIGATKCGTTTLAKYLELHPDISFSSVKEPHFFSRYPDWENHIHTYEQLFTKSEGKIYGEGSPYYTHFPEYPHTPSSIYRYNKNVKLIYIIRNPVERIYSNYKAYYLRNQLQFPVNQFYDEVRHVSLYLDRSKYYTQIMRYLDYFPKDQVLILLFDDLVNSPDLLLSKVFSFLNIRNFSSGELHATGDDLHLNKTADFIHLSREGEKLAKLLPLKYIPKALKSKARYVFRSKIEKVKNIDNQTTELIKSQLYSDINNMGLLINQNLLDKWGIDVRKT